MAQWGRNDQSVTANSTTTYESSTGAPIGTYTLVKGSGNGAVPVSMDANAHFGNTSPGSRANVDVAMFGNTTMNAFIVGQAVGVFGVNASMMGTTGGGIASNGTIVVGTVTYGGTGYAANTANFTPTPTNGGSSASINAIANSTTLAGKITGFNLVTAGTGYNTAPTIPIPAPASISFNGNTGVTNSTSTITVSSANSRFQVNDHIAYTVAAGNTSIVDQTIGPKTVNLYVSFANTTTIAVSLTQGGANAAIKSGPTETGHSIQGDTATGYVDINSVNPQVTHAGWVLRREGSGGRAGRVHYETLVAMSSLGQSGTTATYVTGNATVTANNTVDPAV